MRMCCRLLGMVSIAVGLGLVIFCFWAGEASLHLGSPLRLHGDSSHLVEAGETGRRALELHRVGLQVIDVLDTSLGVHLVSAALFVALGLFLLLLSRTLRSREPGLRATG